MGGKTTISNSETKIEALKLQSSSYGVTAPVIGGTNRVAGNLVYYNDFQAIAHTTSQSSGKGGGVKTQDTSYTYQANVIMGLCQGPIQDIKTIWVGKKRYDCMWAPGDVKQEGSTLTLPCTYTLSAPPTAIVMITATRSTGFLRIETIPLAEGTDFSVNYTTGVITFLPGGKVLGTSIVVIRFTTIPKSSFSVTPMAQLGMTALYGVQSQTPPSWVSQLHPADALGYPYMAAVSAQNYQLGSGAQVENHTFEVIGLGAYSISPSIPDCNPAEFTVSVLTNGRYGARMPSTALESFDAWSSYCLASGIVLSPALTAQQTAAEFVSLMARLTNSAPIWSVNKLKVVPYGDQPLIGNGATFAPNVSPIYDLTDDHFIVESGEAPIRVTRNSRADRYNNVKIQFSNRANYYNVEVMEVKDDADVLINGLRTLDNVPGDWICEPTVAKTVAQLLMQRSLNVTNEYEFRLPWAFSMLEPMDLVTLTDPDLGLNKTAVRITEIEEDENGMLTVKAESFTAGIATAAAYPLQQSSGYQLNYNASPRSVTQPAIFEMPSSKTAKGLGVYVAACGQVGDSLWGGCNVWLSMDGTQYKRIGSIMGGSRIGRLAAPIAAGDASMRVTLDGKGGQINSATAAAAAANQALVWVDDDRGGEYMNFTTATLNAVNDYTLAVSRAAQGTRASAHSQSARFARVDETLAADNALDLSLRGKTLYIKLTSFNAFGGGEQLLSDVPAYPYTVNGKQAEVPPPNIDGFMISGTRLSWNAVDAALYPNVIGYELLMQYGNNPNPNTATVVHSGGFLTAPEFVLSEVPSGVMTYMVRAVTAALVRSVSAPVVVTNLGDAAIANVLVTFDQKAEGWPGSVTGGAVNGSNELQASPTDQFYEGSPATPFFNGGTSTPFFTPAYGELQYETPLCLVGAALRGSLMTIVEGHSAPTTFKIEYRLAAPGPFFGNPADRLFDKAPAFFGPGPTLYMPWPGQLTAQNTGYQFRFTLGAGIALPKLAAVSIVVDAPDLVETLNDVAVDIGGTVIPYTKPFGAIYNVQATLQANLLGGRTVEVDKANPVAPVARVFDSSHNPVGGCSVDFTLKGISQ